MTDPLSNPQPPVALPPYMAGAQVWKAPVGVWLAYDSQTQTMGYLSTLAAADGFWTLQVPVSDTAFSSLLRDAERDTTHLTRRLAVAAPAANKKPV